MSEQQRKYQQPKNTTSANNSTVIIGNSESSIPKNPENTSVKLTLSHIGLLSLMRNAVFPCHTTEIQAVAGVGRKLFWRLIDDLEKSHLITLRYNRFSPIFHAFLTPASLAGVAGTQASLAGVGTPASLAGVAGTPASQAGVVEAHESGFLRETSSTPASQAGVRPPDGGVVVNTPPPTPPTNRIDEATAELVVGDAIRHLRAVMPNVSAGLLIGHTRDAVQAAGSLDAASTRMLRASWALLFAKRTGHAINNPLALYRTYVRDGASGPDPDIKPVEKKVSAPVQEEQRDHSTATREEIMRWMSECEGFSDTDVILRHASKVFFGSPELDAAVSDFRRACHAKSNRTVEECAATA